MEGKGGRGTGKKSLFAQQFESLGPGGFGLVKKPSPLQFAWTSVNEKDIVDPMKCEGAVFLSETTVKDDESIG